MLGTHYAVKAQPALAKKVRAETLPVPAPLKGLSVMSKFSPGDPETATILRNFVVEDDRITVRSGFKKKVTRGTSPVWHLIPYYSTPQALAGASNNEIWNAQDAGLIQGGFTSNDWQWTSFSNLGATDYTILVNGSDGVWSWDGGSTPTGPAVTVTNLSASNPAKCTVASNTYLNGDLVTISGADPAHAMCNGTWTVGNRTATTFDLLGVDSTAASVAQTTGVVAHKAGSIFKEGITVPPADAWINPNAFDTVISHQNQLFFADKANLAVYYLPKLQKSGTISYLPLNLIFRRGGYIKAMGTWTGGDGGTGMNDKLVLFSSNGECAIYGGTDPDADFELLGVFRFDPPMSKHCVANYGGDLYVLVGTGLIPMTTLLKAESEKLGQFDRNVSSIFTTASNNYKNSLGWMVALNPSTGRIFCNIPQGAPNRYRQMVRHMSKGIWQEFVGIPSRCYGWLDPFVYFGDDSGNIYEFHPAHLSDDGQPILVDVMTAWSRCKTPAEKHFLGVHTFMITDGAPRPSIDVKVNYDDSLGLNIPDIVTPGSGSKWDEAVWDVDFWAGGKLAYNQWNGVAASGDVGAIRLTGYVDNCTFSITGWDITFERGRVAP